MATLLGPGKGRVDSPGLGPTAHQGCHGEADDLKVAIIMPLGLEVMVLPGVAPGHGACTVPKGGQRKGCGTESAGWDTGPRELTSSPGDIQKDDALRFQVLNLGG